jgi:hypothetical protein
MLWTPPPSPPASPPYDGVGDDCTQRQRAQTIALLALMMINEQNRKMNQVIQMARLQLLLVQVVLLFACMAVHPGFRRVLGTPQVVNTGYFEASEKMMKPVEAGGKPSQFREVFCFSHEPR